MPILGAIYMIPDQVLIQNELAPVFFILPLVTLHLSVKCLHDPGTKLKSFQIKLAPVLVSDRNFHSSARSYLGSCKRRSKFIPERDGSRPGQSTSSFVFLWFSAVLLRAHCLVRLRSSMSSFGNTFM